MGTEGTMSHRDFEAVLEECLRSLDRGEQLESALARFPQHEGALRRALDMQMRLDARFRIPSGVEERGFHRLQAAVEAPVPTGGRSMLFAFFGGVPKAVAAAIAALLLTGGAMGASAAVGGPNIPGQIWHAIGASSIDDDGDELELHATGTPGGTATPRARSTAKATSTPSASSIPGLCRAAQSGSERGREHKLDSTAFQRLDRAADAAGADDIEEFCEQVLGERKHGKPEPTSTATATALESGQSGHGKSEDKDERSESRSDEKRDGRSKSDQGAAGVAQGSNKPGNAPGSFAEHDRGSRSEESSGSSQGKRDR